MAPFSDGRRSRCAARHAATTVLCRFSQAVFIAASLQQPHNLSQAVFIAASTRPHRPDGRRSRSTARHAPTTAIRQPSQRRGGLAAQPASQPRQPLVGPLRLYSDGEDSRWPSQAVLIAASPQQPQQPLMPLQATRRPSQAVFIAAPPQLHRSVWRRSCSAARHAATTATRRPIQLGGGVAARPATQPRLPLGRSLRL